MDNRKIVYGNAAVGSYTVEAHRHTEVFKSGNRVIASVNDVNYPTHEIDISLLPAASEVYHISPDPKDYVIIPVPILSVDIPNRNMQAFPLVEVSSFDSSQGKIVFQTFQNKGLYVEHAHDDPTASRGIIVDAAMQYVPKYDLWKICILTMWDRTKDKALVQEILRNKKNAFSMGALVTVFSCSICGKHYDDKKPCEHLQKHKIGSTFGDDKRLSFMKCLGSCFFETSYVGTPADPTAVSEDRIVGEGF
jgi:hypothetical protein